MNLQEIKYEDFKDGQVCKVVNNDHTTSLGLINVYNNSRTISLILKHSESLFIMYKSNFNSEIQSIHFYEEVNKK